MKTSAILLSWLVLLFSREVAAQKFVLRETNVDRKKNAKQYINTAKSCELLLLKKQSIATLPISDNSTLTSNAINSLSDKFMSNLPKEIKADIIADKGNQMAIDRDLKNEKQKLVKFTYGTIPTDDRRTTNYVQIVVIFDPKSYTPKIDDIKVKTRSEYITFSDKEIATLKSPAIAVKK